MYEPVFDVFGLRWIAVKVEPYTMMPRFYGFAFRHFHSGAACVATLMPFNLIVGMCYKIHDACKHVNGHWTSRAEVRQCFDEYERKRLMDGYNTEWCEVCERGIKDDQV